MQYVRRQVSALLNVLLLGGTWLLCGTLPAPRPAMAAGGEGWRLEALIGETASGQGGTTPIPAGSPAPADYRELSRRMERKASGRLTALLSPPKPGGALLSDRGAPPLSLQAEGSVSETVTERDIEVKGGKGTEASTWQEVIFEGSYRRGEVTLFIGPAEKRLSVTLSGSGRQRTNLWRLTPIGWRMQRASGERQDSVTVSCRAGEPEASFELREGRWTIRCRTAEIVSSPSERFGELVTVTNRTLEATLEPKPLPAKD